MRKAAHFGAVLAALLVCNNGVFAQPHVVLDSVGPLPYCGKFSSSMALNEKLAVISIANPDELLKTLTLAFKIYSPGDAEVSLDSIQFYNGFDTNWVRAIWTDIDTIPGGIQVSLQADSLFDYLNQQGLPVSADTIPYIGLHFRAWEGPYDYSQVCVDSATATPFWGDWAASPGPAPTWSGEECHPFEHIPSISFITFDNCPAVPLNTSSYCEPIEVWLSYTSWFGEPTYWEQIEGPGELNTTTGLYRFLPTAEDAGDTYEVSIVAYYDYCGDSSLLMHGWCDFTIDVGDSITEPDDIAEFTPSQQQKFVATTEDTLAVTLQVDDNGPCYNHEFSYFIWPEDPDPPGYMDEETGTFYYYGTTADTATYWVGVVLTEHGLPDTLGFYIFHYEDYECGNADHQGDVDIGDLTHLIGYLFQDGISPIPMAAGDVDCVEGIDIGDLTKIIDYLFISYTPLCDGC